MRWLYRAFLLLDSFRHRSWSVFRKPDHIQTSLRRQAKVQLYLHVSYQDLYHAGPENMQLIASVQCGKQISQCQDVSQSSWQKGERGGRENKTKNRSYFSGLSRKSSSCTTLSSGLLISQVLQLTRSSDASRSAWQQKCLERDLNCRVFDPSVAQQFSWSSQCSQDWRVEEGEKHCPYFLPQ